MKKNKIILSIIILILMATIIACFFTTSSGYTEYQNGQRWYYEIVDGEAVNVRIVNFDAETTEITVPETLGGYPVTSVSGFDGQMPFSNSDGLVWYYSNVSAFYNMFNVTGKDFYGHPIDIKVRKVTLPNTIKTIGRNAFWNCRYLEEINIPSSLENIERYAFEYTNIKELELDGVKIGYGVFDASSLEKLTIKNTIIDQSIVNTTYNLNDVVIDEGVTEVSAFGTLPTNCNVQIGNDTQKISRWAFKGVTDVYVNNYKANVELVENAQDVERFNYAYIHFLDGETISTSTIDGVKIINTDTNEEINEINVETGSNFTFKLEQDAEHNYENHTVYIETDNTYYGKSKEVEKIDLPFGETYTIENVMRNKKIYIQERASGLDLNLRQYIKSINSSEIGTLRIPKEQKQANGTFKFTHLKTALYPRKDDIVQYGIRIYNEGTIEGTATKITEFIPEGLKFDESSAINSYYNWELSADGRTATTTFLAEETINPYTIYDVDYREIFIDLIVDLEPSNTFVRLVNIAEVTEATSTDVDSTPGNITEPVDGTYLKEESENSTEDSYIQGTEDDNDFENIVTSNNVQLPYSLKINKIDGIDYELLNGATFDLLDSDKNVIRTGVTANNGELNFGTVYTHGEGTTKYYIRETYTPEGYKNHLKFLVEVAITNTVNGTSGLDTKVELDIKDIDIDTSKFKTIAISSKEDLMAIESNKEEKYVLTQDIDLEEDWIPLNVQNVKLDGQGHKITGLKLIGNDETLKTWGLFSTYSGIIENLSLEGVNINITKFDTEESTDIVDGVGGFIGYSDGVILKNCKVTGAIGDSLRNIGGLVGHTKAGSIIVTRDCINQATVHFTNSSNAGGIVGCALGPVKSYNDINRGAVTGSAYNVGGIVGYARQDGYERTQVFAEYNDTTKLITVALKNEAIDGKYQFKISKTDEFGNKLNGAKFQILDRDKQVIPGYASIEATDGIINYEETRISCIGNDVYYIKEVEAPEGYLAIEDNYIKVVVNKKWDREEEKYYTETTYKVLSNEEFATEVSEDYNASNTKSGQTYTKVDANIQWNINEIDIENAANNANITGTGNNESVIVGGILGKSQGRAIISGSTNEAQVVGTVSNSRSAGIAGTIDRKNNEDEAQIINCTNNGKIISYEPSSSSYVDVKGNTAGILAYSRSTLTIDGCDNNESISSGNVASGILGRAVGIIKVENCNNKGSVSSKNRSAAGIFAENFFLINTDTDYSVEEGEVVLGNESTTIKNCTNSANISTSSTYGDTHTSGIYGVGDTFELNIQNCTVTNNCKIEGKGDVAGIASLTSSELTRINNCKVENVELYNSITTSSANTKHTSGILGSIMTNTYVMLPAQERSHGTDKIIYIEDCDVIDTNMTGPTVAGIEAFGGYGIGYINGLALISNISRCNVKNTKMTATCSNSNYASGIFGQSYTGNHYNITSCKVEDSEITANGSNYADVAGIFSFDYQKDGANQGDTINISNCEVVGTTLTNNKVHDYSNTSGILGDLNNGDNISISNSRVYDCEITGRAGNVAGIFNLATTIDTANATITNCTVEKTNILNSTAISSSNYSNTGGIGGYVHAKSVFNNCDVIDCEITANQSKNMGGIAGFLRYTDNVNENSQNLFNCNVLRTKLENSYPNTSNSNTMGGLVAGTLNTTLNVTECSVEDSSISGMARNIGGMFGAGQSGKINTFEDCLVDGTTLTLTQYYSESLSKTMGGICAGGTEGFTLTNCTVSDSNLNSKQGATGGMVGSSVYNSTFTGCTVDNVKITNEGTYGSSSTQNYNKQSTGGIIGGLSDSSSTELSLTNCNVINNCEIASNTQSTGGLAGSCYTLSNLSGCKVQDLKITSNAPWNTGDAGSIAGLVGDSNTVKNGILNNTVKNVEITTKSDRTAGLLGEVYSSSNPLAITGNTVQNLTLHHTGEIGNRVRHMAGFIGYLYPETNLSNNVLKNCTMTADAGNLNAADIAGICSFVSNKINIDGTNSFSGINITNNTPRGLSGGLVAVSGVVKIANLQNYNNISIKGNDNVGGIIAMTNSSDTSIKGVQGSNITVNGYNYTGGLVGFYQWDNFVMEDIELNTVKASGKGCVGGLIGFVRSTSLKNIELTNVTAENTATSKITAYNAYGSSVGYTYNHTGGIIGNAGNSTIEDVTINGLKMTNNAQDGNTGGIVGNIAKPDNYYTETIMGTFTGITINKVGETNNSITASSGYVGSLLGYGTLTTSDINISNTDITSTGASGTGTVGFLTTGSDLKDVTVNSCNISADEGHVGGIVGMANDNIENCIITDSEVKLTGTTGATGGILGHGSNVTGTDVSITNCKVITTAITGNNQVGGISGGAVNTIEGCYVGGKENVTYTEDEPAVIITGNDSVGGIIGDAGIITADTQMMITLKDNTIQDTKIERNERAKLTGESDDEYKIIGTHNSFGMIIVEEEEVQYTGTQAETITGNTVTNVILNEITE